MLVEDRELFNSTISRYLNGSLPSMEVHGPSTALEEDFQSGNYRYLIPLVHTSPVDTFYAIAKLGQIVDRFSMTLLMRKSTFMAERVVSDFNAEKAMTSERISQDLKGRNPRLLVRLLYRILKPDVSRRLNGFYRWIEDDKAEFHPLRCYLAVGWLRLLEDYGIQLDPDVSTELSRVRQRFLHDPWPKLKQFADND